MDPDTLVIRWEVGALTSLSLASLHPLSPFLSTSAIWTNLDPFGPIVSLTKREEQLDLNTIHSGGLGKLSLGFFEFEWIF